MNTKKMFLCGLLIMVVWFIGHESGWAGPEQAKSVSKFGVVSVRRIFAECKRNATYRQQTMAEQESLVAELDKLEKELEASRAGLKTFKPGSAEYLSLSKEVLQKQANLQAQQEFARQQLSLKDQRWTEQLYNDILVMTADVAVEKGLEIVFERDEVELPAVSANDLMLAIRTHKLLYSGGCIDITTEVMTRVDAKN